MFLICFHLSSDISPNVFLFFLFFGIGDFLYIGFFSLFIFFSSKLLSGRVFSGHSKLLEKTLPCTEHASTFDQGHIFNLDLR